MRFWWILTVALVTLSCSARHSDDSAPAPDEPAVLKVDNQNFADMTIYVVDGAQRQRLGLARGNGTSSFTIPDRLVRRGTGLLRFLADPIGGRGLPVTEEIPVSPGDEVTLTIPPS